MLKAWTVLHKNDRESGQVSIMIAMMLMTFLFFLQFVVNTGILVSAKINLQNAADLAVYSGAAAQARQLNSISYLNYEMRRQYKKFLFRYYFLGTMADKNFKGDMGLPGGYPTPPTPPAPNNGRNYAAKVPVVCLLFEPPGGGQTDNWCHLDTLPTIQQLPGFTGATDPIANTLNTFLAEIESIRTKMCTNVSKVNQIALLLWLYNTDPEGTQFITNRYASEPCDDGSPQDKQNCETIKATINNLSLLTKGIGLVPRNILINLRIESLQALVNAAPKTELDFEKAKQLEQGPDPALWERTLNAFYTAYYTLGEHTFPGPNIQMDELLPAGNNNDARLLNLIPITTSFPTFFNQVWPAEGSTNPDVPEGTCLSSPAPVAVEKVPVGVQKDPKILTYYALRLRAKARLFLSPFGNEVDLKAYAAAQPFGSRIGPPLSGQLNQGFIVTGPGPRLIKPSGEDYELAVLENTFRISYKLPDDFSITTLPDVPVDQTQPKSFFTKDVQQMFLTALGIGSGNNVVDAEKITFATQLAMGPNPYEAGKYNIPNDLGNMDTSDSTHQNGGDPFIKLFTPMTPDNGGANRLAHSIWAPLIKPGQGGQDPKEAVRSSITAMLSRTDEVAGATNAQQSGVPEEFKRILIDGVLTYMDSLSQGKGEDGEGINIARIIDPIYYFDSTSSTQKKAISGPFIVSDLPSLKSSYNTDHDASYAQRGRIGYSVKLVAFKTLMTPTGVTADGQTTWDPISISDTESADEVLKLAH